MRIAKIIPIILIIFISFPVLASNLAMVTAQTAIIYADDDLKAPIGTLTHGTKIKIGENLRKNGTVAYTTFNNHVVYLQVKDISISKIKNKLHLENTRFKLKAINDKIAEEKLSFAAIALRLAQSAPGNTWSKVASEMETNNSPFYSIGLQAELNLKQGPLTFFTGYEYTRNYDDQLKITMYTFDFGLSYKLLETNLFSWDILAGPIVSPGILIETENGQYYTRGAGYGHQVGSTLKLYSRLSWGITVGLIYRYQSLSGHEKIQKPGDYYEPVELSSLTEYRTVVMISRRINL